MAKWFHSGRRRDLCALLYDHGELRAQSLKSRLESRYDERIDPGSFYGTLSAMVDAGHLDRRTEGIADVYALTDAGEAALLDHYAWFSERVDAGGAADGTGRDPDAEAGVEPGAGGAAADAEAGAEPDAAGDADLKD